MQSTFFFLCRSTAHEPKPQETVAITGGQAEAGDQPDHGVQLLQLHQAEALQPKGRAPETAVK